MPSTSLTVDALVLAAGMSVRMGEQNKLLALLFGRPLIQHVVSNLADAGVRHTYVIIGFESEKIRQALLDYPVKFIPNPNFFQGMKSSLLAGVNHIVKDPPTGLMVCLGDMPMLSTADYQACIRTFIEYYEIDKQLIVRARHRGQAGHPVIFSQSFFPELKHLPNDPNSGALAIIKQHHDKIKFCQMDHPGCIQDIDTPQDLSNLAESDRD